MPLDTCPKSDVVIETAILMNDHELFLHEFKDLQLKSTTTLLTRLSKWQGFFLKKYTNAPCIFSSMNLSLLEAARSNHVFKTQTTHEFEMSLAFFGRLIESGIFLKIDDLESATYLLNTSLIFSKYPGMVVGSFKKSFNCLTTGINTENLQLMFESLYVKYECPRFLIKNLNLLSFEEIEALMHILKGNNLRTFKKLPIRISKKQSYLLMNELPEEISFKDAVLTRAIVASKLLLGIRVSDCYLTTFLNYSKVFERNPWIIEKNMNFWKRTINLISLIVENDNYLSVEICIDYFEYMKHVENQDYSVKGRTAVSLSRDIYEWHGASDFEKNRRFKNFNWPRRTQKDVVLKKGNSEFLFKELTTGQELLNESQTLKHCVFSYAEYCVQGLRSIWSLQRKVKKAYKPYITIEVQNKSIVQLGGKHNRWINKEEHELIDEWAVKMEFENKHVVF